MSEARPGVFNLASWVRHSPPALTSPTSTPFAFYAEFVFCLESELSNNTFRLLLDVYQDLFVIS